MPLLDLNVAARGTAEVGAAAGADTKPYSARNTLFTPHAYSDFRGTGYADATLVGDSRILAGGAPAL